VSRLPELYRWKQQLANHLPGLPPAVVALLALWSFGFLLARRTGLDTVAGHLARLLGKSDNTTRQHLREFYQEAAAKAGSKRGIRRTDFDPADCFAPLLRWLLSFWGCRRLALALDPTNLGDRLHVLCVSVVYGGIAIPVAWKILPGGHQGAWNPHWAALLRRLKAELGPDWTVVVLSDRGLESAQLFGDIVRCGWHPLMRVKAAGQFRPAGWVRWYPFKQLVPRVGGRFVAAGRAYKTAAEPLCCTLMGCWDEGHAEAWLILTDLAAGAASPCWYAFRSWIEQQFKMTKGGGLHWQNTRMSDPGRAERLWLAIAVALLWLVVIGAAVESDGRPETIGAVPVGQERGHGRRQRLLVRGLAEWLAAQLRGRPLPQGTLAPDPWPAAWHDVSTPTEEDFCSDNTYP
jgi:hypothetical protein